MDIGESSADNASAVEDTGATVEIKIKTLDAQSYTLRVDKDTPVPALKDQIASVVGVPVESQRLICRGKVLKDDQVLSAYNVEDGHTLHLVARQPPQPPLLSTGPEQAAGSPGPSDMVIVSPRNRSGHVSHSLVMGTINIPDTGEGGMPDLNRIISAVLNSVGIGNAIPATAGTGTGGTVTVGVMPTRAPQGTGIDGQPRPEGVESRLPAGVPLGFENAIPRELEATLHIDTLYGAPATGIYNGTGANAPSPFRIVQQPVVVPDALTTMSQYLDRLEQSFSFHEGGTAQSTEGTSVNEAANSQTGLEQISLSPPVQAGVTLAPSLLSESSVSTSNPTNDTSQTGVSVGQPTPPRRLPTPQALGAIVRRVQELLSGQAGTALVRLATQLENEPTLFDAAARGAVQATAVRDGHMMQNLGALLLELGRTTLALRMGPSPTESVVNAGPAVFISPSGPNPMIVQSLPLLAGVALGSLPVGTPQPSGGIVGPTVGPGSINIHIHTSDLRLPSSAPSPPPPPPPPPPPFPSSPQRPPPRAVVGASSGAPTLTVRQLMERAETGNPEHGLTMRQIIERAEAVNGVQPGVNSELNPHPALGGAVQGAIMTFNENGAMRVVPVRTRTAAVPIGSYPGGTNDSSATALLARFQQQPESLQHRPPPPLGSAGITPGSTSGEEPPSSVRAPALEAQVQIQSWGPFIQALDAGLSHPALYTTPAGEVAAPGAHSGATGGQTGTNVEGATLTQGQSGSVPPNVESNLPVENQREGNGDLSRQPAHSVSRGPGVSQRDVYQIVDSLGPLLEQLATAFHQARSPPSDGPHPDQSNEQPSVPQPRMGNDTSNARVSSSLESESQANLLPEQGSDPTLTSDHPQHSGSVSDGKSDGKSEGHVPMEATLGFQHAPLTSTSTPSTSDRLPDEGRSSNTMDLQDQEVMDTQDRSEDKSGNPPLGLGLGGLQPLPMRARRRGQGHHRQPQPSDVSEAGGTGSGVSVSRGNEQAMAPTAARNLLQSLASRMDRPSTMPDGNSMEQSLGQLTQSLMPLLGSMGSSQNEDASIDFGDIMGQLMSRASDGNSGQQGFPASMLRGMMGQIVQSPLMENLVQQVMTSTRTDETQNSEQAFTGLGSQSHGGIDFGSIMQQMLPVVSQILGGRPTPGTGQQGPSSANAMNHNDEGAPRDSPGQTNDSGRWRETLSEEEAALWSETISADVEQQQSLAPQRPFSDVYARGGPVAKRQKTDLEGTAEKLQNGGTPEDVLRSVAENAAVQFVGSNGSTRGEASQLAQHLAAIDGISDAYMAVLFHDLAARVAADPDFGDGSQFPNATRVFQQQKTTQEADGG